MKFNKAVVAILALVVIALAIFMLRNKDEGTVTDETAVEQTIETPTEGTETGTDAGTAPAETAPGTEATPGTDTGTGN